MLIEGRQDEQSKYQARDIESKDNPAVMNKVATKKKHQNVGRVVILIHIKMNALAKENSAISVANQIILPKFVKRPKRRVIRRKEANQARDKRNLYNRLKSRKVVIQNQMTNVYMPLIQDTRVQKSTSRLVGVSSKRQ